MTLKFQAFECQENILEVKVLSSENSENSENSESSEIFFQHIRLKFRLIFLWSQIDALLLIRALGAEINDFKEYLKAKPD
jgi:hypothetical protein